jgi:hypothetical protein
MGDTRNYLSCSSIYRSDGSEPDSQRTCALTVHELTKTDSVARQRREIPEELADARDDRSRFHALFVTDRQSTLEPQGAA